MSDGMGPRAALCRLVLSLFHSYSYYHHHNCYSFELDRPCTGELSVDWATAHAWSELVWSPSACSTRAAMPHRIEPHPVTTLISTNIQHSSNITIVHFGKCPRLCWLGFVKNIFTADVLHPERKFCFEKLCCS